MNDLVDEMRQTWREITESDGAESPLMKDYRLACDRIEELEAALREIAAHEDHGFGPTTTWVAAEARRALSEGTEETSVEGKHE